jgi:hypothetical protein
MTLLRTVDTLRTHRAMGRRHLPGEVYECPRDVALHCAQSGYVRLRPWAYDWAAMPKREMRVPRAPTVERPLVACLAIWQDTPALRQTASTWWPHMDAVAIADGSYRDLGTRPSTDGLHALVEQLAAEHGTPVTWVPMPETGWDQCEKRTALLQAASGQYPDARLLIVDADEFVTDADKLRTRPDFEVGWVTLTSPLYERPYNQPRVLRADPRLRYDGRHHWLYRGDQLLATHQQGGLGIRHGLAPIRIHNARGLGQPASRTAAKQQHLKAQRAREVTVGRDHPGARESLRILQLGRADAGLVAFRLHTAINTTTPHMSAHVIGSDANPFKGPIQVDWPAAKEEVHALADTADVIHCHLSWHLLAEIKPVTGWRVIHHHGSMYRKYPAIWSVWDAKEHANLRLVSNTELLQYDSDLRFLPNPVPVAWYQALKARTETGPGFRVAHSPSRRALKGTDVFLRACERAEVEPVLIERERHADAIRIKASCHAAFDSFWLGLQCSGLEAAAMGLPVIAGDPDCKREYERWLGAVPYTWANDEDALVEALQRLKADSAFYAAEAARVSAYVTTHHDDAAVAARYLDLLDEAVGWRQAMRIDRRPRTQEPASPMIPRQRIPQVARPPAVTVPAPGAPLQESA